MSRIILKVIDRTITAVDSPPIYSGGKNVDDVQFQFDDEWSTFKKTAVFYRDEDNQFMATLTGDICTIPHEVLTRDGKLYFGVFGESGDKVITSEVVVYMVDRGVLTDPTSSDDPTFWDKLLEIKNEILQAKDEAHDYANQAQQSAEKLDDYYYDGLYAQGETYSGIASNKGVKLHKVVGKTEQETTKGYQLFDASRLPTTSQGGATVTNNGDGSFTISGSGNTTEKFDSMFIDLKKDEVKKLLKAGKLYGKVEKVTNPFVGFLIFANGKWTELNMNISDYKSVTITEEMLNADDLYARITFYGGQNGTIKTGTIKPMFYQDGDGTWEQFTGGKPSPNADYPMEVKNVEIKNINSGTNQLFDASKLPTTSVGGATVTNNGDGSFTVSGSGNLTEKFNTMYFDLRKDYVKKLLKNGNLYVKFEMQTNPFVGFLIFANGKWTELNTNTTPKLKYIIITEEMLNADDLYARITFYGGQNGTIKTGTIKPMFYQDGDGTWEPFKHATVETSLTLAEGEVYEEGQPFVRKRKKVVFDGSSDEAWGMDSSQESFKRFYVRLDSMIRVKDYTNIMKCNRFSIIKGHSTIELGATGYATIGDYPNKNWFYINGMNDFETVGEFKTWLSTHNVEVEYELATPTTETIKVPTVPSYSPHTNVWTDNQVPTDMEWELLANSDNSLQVEALEKRIEALEAKAIGG